MKRYINHTSRIKASVVRFICNLIFLILICTNSCVIAYSQGETTITRQIELRKNQSTRFVYAGRLVKIDYSAADSLIQEKGKISTISDSFVFISDKRIRLKSIRAIYINRPVLGTTLIIIGAGLIVWEVALVARVSMPTSAIKPNFNPFILLPGASGFPITAAGLVSVLYWKKYDMSKGWAISITEIKNLKTVQESPP
jgi:hypothetical protein